jgi:hypothetical protein
MCTTLAEVRFGDGQIFLSGHDVFPQKEIASKVNTLGLNYSALLNTLKILHLPVERPP